MSSENIKSLEECPALDHRQPIFYFDFAPILARSVSLSQNPERVQIMCEQCVRRLAPGDIVLPQPSGFFLLVQSCAGISAEALAHEINIALLELFFGTEALKGLGTICRRATLTEINEKGLSVSLPANAPRTCTEPPKELPVEDPLKRLADSGVPGYDNLSTAFLPLINLKSNCASVFLCGALRQVTGGALFGPAALAGTPAQDRASLDEALLEYSNQFARHVIPTRSATAIATSVSYETLASPRGRRLYQQALRSLGVANNPFLLVKIEDVPAGLHAARCAEIVSLRPAFRRRVFVELQNDSAESGGSQSWRGGPCRGPARRYQPQRRGPCHLRHHAACPLAAIHRLRPQSQRAEPFRAGQKCQRPLRGPTRTEPEWLSGASQHGHGRNGDGGLNGFKRRHANSCVSGPPVRRTRAGPDCPNCCGHKSEGPQSRCR